MHDLFDGRGGGIVIITGLWRVGIGDHLHETVEGLQVSCIGSLDCLFDAVVAGDVEGVGRAHGLEAHCSATIIQSDAGLPEGEPVVWWSGSFSTGNFCES